MENYTKNALLFLFVGLIISIIGTMISGIYQFFVPVENMEHVFGYVGLAGISSIGGVLTLIGGILFLVGRKEFGKKHQQFVFYAVIVFIIGIISSAVIGGIGVFISISESIIEGTAINTMGTTISILISTLIGSITGGLTYVLALYHLEDEQGKKLLYVAFIISVIIAVLISFLSMGSINQLLENIPTDGSSMEAFTAFSFTSTITQYSMLGVISNAFWAIAIYLPYKRIKTGELKPKSTKPLASKQELAERVCPNCNKTIPNDALHCPYCGKQFESYL